MPLIRMIRLGVRLPAKGGRIPSPLQGGRLRGHPGVVATYRHLSRSGKGRVNLRPQVRHETGPDGSNRTRIDAEENEARSILDTLAVRHSQRGGAGIRVLEES